MHSSVDFSLAPFADVIPGNWREEILEPPDSPLKQPVMYAIMQGFGSLACLLFTRLLRMSKEIKDDRSLVRDLRQVYSITLNTMKALSKRRQELGEDCCDEDKALRNDNRKYAELKFMDIILNFFNYHVSMAKREHVSRSKVHWLVTNLLPSFQEMREALENYYVHEDVSYYKLPNVMLTPFFTLGPHCLQTRFRHQRTLCS